MYVILIIFLLIPTNSNNFPFWLFVPNLEIVNIIIRSSVNRILVVSLSDKPN